MIPWIEVEGGTFDRPWISIGSVCYDGCLSELHTMTMLDEVLKKENEKNVVDQVVVKETNEDAPTPSPTTVPTPKSPSAAKRTPGPIRRSRGVKEYKMLRRNRRRRSQK